jgi:hypothetical protein
MRDGPDMPRVCQRMPSVVACPNHVAAHGSIGLRRHHGGAPCRGQDTCFAALGPRAIAAWSQRLPAWREAVCTARYRSATAGGLF